MSTDLDHTARPRVARRAAALVALLAATLTCTHAPSYRLSDLCVGGTVAQRLTLVVDSVPDDLSQRYLIGRRYDVQLSLINLLNPPKCANREGEASIVASLPDALENAITTRDQVPRWRIDGPEVVVDLNPGVLGRHVVLRLPLDGSTGRWSLDSVTGDIASGRLIPEPR